MNIAFDLTTQAKRWSFSRETLFRCREHCLSLGPDAKPRNFASGFHYRFGTADHSSLSSKISSSDLLALNEPSDEPALSISLAEKESFLRFHSNQIAKLVGPSAVCSETRKSPKVVATAISLFRRYYLSNDVLGTKYSPHQMKAAAVFLASKVEDEPLKVG